MLPDFSMQLLANDTAFGLPSSTGIDVSQDYTQVRRCARCNTLQLKSEKLAYMDITRSA